MPADARMKMLRCSGAGLALIVGASLFDLSPADAQSIDYGSLQQLFGEPVTTSVTGSPQRASDVPAAMEIITQDEIRRSGATDVPGVLRHVTGIDVLQWSADQSDIVVRGYDQADTPRILVLVDGRQVYADYYGYMPWSILPVELNDIQQIEVVKGPASALFGFNAAGGVINIVTKNPLYASDNNVSLIGGTQKLAQGQGSGTISLGDLGAIRISTGAHDDRDFSTPVPTASLGSTRIGEDRVALDVNTLLRLSDKVQLRINTSGIVSNDNTMLPNYVMGSADFTGASVLGQINADTDYGLLQATAYTNWLQAKSHGPGLAGPVDFDNQVTSFQLQDIFKPGNAHTLRATIEYRRNTDNTAPITGGNVFYEVYAVGGMWSWAIDPALTLTNAVRVDQLNLGRNGTFAPGLPFTNQDWNRSITQPTFNSGLVWKATDDDTLRLTAGQSAQLPSLVHFGAISQLGATGNPALQPETVTDYELGWDRDLGAIGGTFRASLFHQESRNLLHFAGSSLPTLPIPTSLPINAGHSLANGLALAVNGTVADDWRWGVSYRWENVSDTFPQGLTNLTTFTDFEHSTPRHLAKANLGWANGPWELDGYLTYQSRIFGLTTPNVQSFVLSPINAYVSVDGRVAYKLTDDLTLAVSGQNLLTARQQQTAGPEVERRLFAWITFGF